MTFKSSLNHLLLVLFPLFLLVCQDNLSAYERPSHLPGNIWLEMSPYFLPENDPAAPKLLKILKKRRATLNKENLTKSGFTSIKTQPYTKMTTAKHPSFPTLFFKLYFDVQKPYKKQGDYTHWLSRIRGANLIRALIEEKGWQDMFKVPKKWIFPLPKTPAPPSIFYGVTSVLVEENMELLPNEKNLEAWKSSLVTEELLNRLLYIVYTLGLSDCLYPNNIPFSIDNKIAFIDTETHMSFPIRHKNLVKYLSPEMAVYWENLKK